MLKLFATTATFFLMLFAFVPSVSAEDVVSTSAELAKRRNSNGEELDLRVYQLMKFLQSQNSPLVKYADEFIKAADKYDLDWRLVPAIAGVESTFAKIYPNGSYNAYGWANGKYRFTSWENSIEVVSQALREKYYDKGATDINKIARRYAPPSKTWAWKVKFFMEKIDSTPIEFDL